MWVVTSRLRTPYNNHEANINNHETNINNHETNINNHETNINNHGKNINNHENSYDVGKSDMELMSLIIENDPAKEVKIVMDDDLKFFQQVSSDPGFSITKLYKWYNGLKNLASIAAIYGSVKRFKYIMLNFNLSPSILGDAISGGNIEIIRICCNKFDKNTIEQQVHLMVQKAIKYNRMEILEWIFDEYSDRILFNISLSYIGRYAASLFLIEKGYFLKLTRKNLFRNIMTSPWGRRLINEASEKNITNENIHKEV